MAELNFGGVIETVMTREEFPLEKAREKMCIRDRALTKREAWTLSMIKFP